jgi:predicted nicotinamide N-methyase
MPDQLANEPEPDPPAGQNLQRATAFIIANTRLLSPPLVPEIRLHLAEESLPIWTKTEEELAEQNIPPPYWAFAWAGGQALARYIIDHPECVQGKTVIDIGTGSGLVAIAALMSGASAVLAADIDHFSVVAAELNARANNFVLRTTRNDLLADDRSPEADVLLLGDLFYEARLSASALAMARKMAARGTVVLCGDPQRSYFPQDAFERLAEFSVPVTRELEDNEIKRTSVWRLAPGRDD